MIDAVRWSTVVLSVAAVLIGTPQWRRMLASQPADVVQGRLALAALNCAVGYGTAEALTRGVVGGPRSIVAAIGTLWALYAVAWHPVTELIRHHRRNHDPADVRPRRPRRAARH
jgi:hypothetical protein